MFALGLILVLLAVIIVIYVLIATGGEPAMKIDWFVFSADITPLGLFLLGAATVLVLSIGSVLLSIGLKRSGAKRAEVKKLRKEVKAKDSSNGSRDSHDTQPRRDTTTEDSKSKDTRTKDSSDGERDRSSSHDRPKDPSSSSHDRDAASPSEGSGGTTQRIPPPPPPPRS